MDRVKWEKERGREKYGGSDNLEADGHWNTNADGYDEKERRAMEVYAAEAFAEAEAACTNLVEEGAVLLLYHSWDSAREDSETRLDIAARATSALAILEIARRGLPRREYVSSLDSEAGRALMN